MVGMLFLALSLVFAAIGFVVGLDFSSGITLSPTTANPSFMLELSLRLLNTTWQIGCGLLGLALCSLPFAVVTESTLKPSL